MKKPLKDLRPHPLNTQIYGDELDQSLVESIEETGILQPLLIDGSNRIICGHRRFHAASKLGLTDVPVQLFGSKDDLDIEAALVEGNRQRVKTNEQESREAAHLLKIEQQRASIRQAQANAKQKVPAKSPEHTGDARDITGRKLGMGGKKVQQSAVVIEAIDRLRKIGDDKGAEKITTELNKYSVNRAFKVARESGYLEGSSGDKPPAKEDYILIKKWTSMSHHQQDHALKNGYEAGQFTCQSSDSIEWAKFSWNPVTGCDRGCDYCYARDMAVHNFPQGFAPSFYPGRLRAPGLSKPPVEAAKDVGFKNVFCCSMADLFGPWVPKSLIQLVIETAASAPEWNFLFLSKYPKRLSEFDFPKNAWVGTSIDSQGKVEAAEKAFENVRASVRWISCEPLMERIIFSRLDLFDWLVIGGASKSTQTPEFRPPREWVEHLWKQADAAGCKIYEKPNLLSRRREYPMQSKQGAIQTADPLR